MQKKKKEKKSHVRTKLRITPRTVPSIEKRSALSLPQGDGLLNLCVFGSFKQELASSYSCRAGTSLFSLDCFFNITNLCTGYVTVLAHANNKATVNSFKMVLITFNQQETMSTTLENMHARYLTKLGFAKDNKQAAHSHLKNAYIMLGG